MRILTAVAVFQIVAVSLKSWKTIVVAAVGPIDMFAVILAQKKNAVVNMNANANANVNAIAITNVAGKSMMIDSKLIQ